MLIVRKKLFSRNFIRFFRQEATHIVENVAFENAKLKILGENDQKYFTQSELKQGGKYQVQIDLEEELASNCQDRTFKFLNFLKKKIFLKFWLFSGNFLSIKVTSKIVFSKYLIKLELKNCKVSGNFGDLEILTDGTVPETVETLVKKEPATETKSAGLDYTAFMVNKEKSSKHIYYTNCPHRIYMP